MSIEAMKQALEALEEIYRTGDTQAFDLCYAPNVIPALRQAIAEAEKQEPEPEPITVEFREYLTRLNWQQGFERGWDEAVEKLTLTQEKLGYTAPPKREWVDLTEDEIFKLYMNSGYGDIDDCLQFEGLARAIEAKLKEKNT